MTEPTPDSPANSTDAPDTPTATPLAVSPVLHRLGAAFTFSQYRNVWLAAFTSATGTWVQRFAQQVLILNLTGSAFMLALNTFFAELPLLLFTLFGGVIADRHDRRHLLMGSQTVQMACALTLTAIVLFDVTRVRYILALSFITGLAQAFGGPAFQSMLPSLVPRCSAPGFLDSGLTVFASMLPRPARRSHVAPERGFDSGTSLASTARCTSA